MSQKKNKEKRKLETVLTNAVKGRTLDIALQKCKNNNINFDDLEPLEKIKLVNSAKAEAERDINFVMQYSEDLSKAQKNRDFLK